MTTWLWTVYLMGALVFAGITMEQTGLSLRGIALAGAWPVVSAAQAAEYVIAKEKLKRVQP